MYKFFVPAKKRKCGKLTFSPKIFSFCTVFLQNIAVAGHMFKVAWNFLGLAMCKYYCISCNFWFLDISIRG